MFDRGGLLRGQVEDREAGRENNACFSCPSPKRPGLEFTGGRRILSKSSCLPSKTKSKAGVLAPAPRAAKREALRSSHLPSSLHNQTRPVTMSFQGLLVLQLQLVISFKGK